VWLTKLDMMDKESSYLNDYFREIEFHPPGVLIPRTGSLVARDPLEIDHGEFDVSLDSAGCCVKRSNWIRLNYGWDRILFETADLLHLGSKNTAGSNTDMADSAGALSDEEKYQEMTLNYNSRAVKSHNSEDSLYYQIRSKNLTTIPTKYLIPLVHEVPDDYLYDANGATLVHQCFHYQRYEMVKWLVRSFPKFCLKPYRIRAGNNLETDADRSLFLPYGGQNLLHMAVLARNHEFARWLLEFYGKHSDRSLFELVTARVVTQGSSYFRKTGSHYYGETPLQFAVCMNEQSMVDLILSSVSLLHTELFATDVNYQPSIDQIPKGRNLLFMPDCNGNNAIHLCVLFNLPEMYDHVRYVALEMIRQELMRAYHNSVSVARMTKPYQPISIDYCVFYRDSLLEGRRSADAQNVTNMHATKPTMNPAVMGLGSPSTVVDSGVSSPVSDAGQLTQPLLHENTGVTRILSKNEDFHFRGYVRKLNEIELPPENVRQLFVDVQAGKLKLDSVGRTESVADREVLKLLADAYTDKKEWLAPEEQKAVSPAEQAGLLYNKPTLDLQTGSLYDTETDRNALLRELFQYPSRHSIDDWNRWFKKREDELKQEMRQWLYGTDIGLKNGAIHRLFNELFMLGLNEQGHSPVTLAAAQGKGRILRHLIEETVIARDGSYDFDLAAVEFPLIECGADRNHYSPFVPPTLLLHGAIWWICRKEQNNKLIDEIPEIKAVIAAKWDRVGYMIANRNNHLHFVFLVPLVLLTCLVIDNDDEYTNHKIFGQWSTYLLGFCSLVFVCIAVIDLNCIARELTGVMRAKLLVEVANDATNSIVAVEEKEVGYLRWAWMYSRAAWMTVMNRRPVGAGLFDFSLRLLIAGTFTAAGFVRLLRVYYGSENYVNNLYCTLIGACCLFTMVYSFLFLALNENDFGSFLVTVTRILLKDFSYFARFWLRIVVMFGLALKTVTDDVDDNGFLHAFRCIWALVRLSFPNGIPTEEYEPLARKHTFEPIWFSVLTTLFCLLVNILIINLLIAVMSNTYNAFYGKNSLGMLNDILWSMADDALLTLLFCCSDSLVSAVSVDGLLHFCIASRRSDQVTLQILSCTLRNRRQRVQEAGIFSSRQAI
jgi:hypothetical protein